MPITIDDLFVPYSAQFYRLKEDMTLSIAKIRDIMDNASKNKQIGKNNILNISRQTITVNGESFKYSVRVYPSKRKVQFLASNSYIDIIHAYILLIEFDDSVVIFKKSVSNISSVLSKYLEPLKYQEILNVFNDEESHIQRMSTRNMTISDQAILGKTLETHNDLKGLMSMHSAGKAIPKNLRFKEHNITKAVTASTARIIELAEKNSIEEICKWSKKQVDTILGENDNRFIEQFSQPIGLNEVLDVTTPNALLIEVHSILNDLGVLNLYIKRKNGIYQILPEIIKQNGLNLFEKIFDIVVDEGQEKIYVDSVEIGFLKRNDKSLTFNIPILQRVLIDYKGDYISLQKYIINKRFYSLVFHKFEYMYYRGECFLDKSGESEMKSILDVLIPKDEILSVTEEKGNISSTKTESYFDDNSMFFAVENMHDEDNYIFCDDYGNEWCDHITMNIETREINFIHSKAHNDVGVSASKMHEVVGQGIKNLGNMFMGTEKFMLIKRAKFQNKYLSTNIDRIRKGALEAGDIELIDEVINDYKTHRQCILSCSFLSKSQIEEQFERLKDEEIVPGNIYQLYWIISSFIHACRDMNVVPKIYCKP